MFHCMPSPHNGWQGGQLAMPCTSKQVEGSMDRKVLGTGQWHWDTLVMQHYPFLATVRQIWHAFDAWTWRSSAVSQGRRLS